MFSRQTLSQEDQIFMLQALIYMYLDHYNTKNQMKLRIEENQEKTFNRAKETQVEMKQKREQKFQNCKAI